VRNGEQETLNLCDVGYRRLARQRRAASPLEPLFGGRAGSLFDDFFDNDFWSDVPAGSHRIPVTPDTGQGRRRASAGSDNRLSAQANELLQRAASRRAEAEPDVGQKADIGSSFPPVDRPAWMDGVVGPDRRPAAVEGGVGAWRVTPE
jgi:hypothetical protein